MSDKETMAVYAKAAADYAKGFARSKDTFHEPDYEAFTAGLPSGGSVLDLGCGPGHWAARFRDDGYTVTAMDASPEMATYAQDAYDLEVTVGRFEDITSETSYDGIWAFFSLLHAPRSEFPGHLLRLHNALRPRGMLALGMKLGTAEGRDELGRFYAYYSEDELRTLLSEAGFTPPWRKARQWQRISWRRRDLYRTDRTCLIYLPIPTEPAPEIPAPVAGVPSYVPWTVRPS